ncbi:type I methionyl aminopeptidase [Bacteroidales bacterium OttesenSCG-928-C19]|nr:type I methionyl aminopeptidase [Bacteroidales bacterium OttesenSCG-928-C19]
MIQYKTPEQIEGIRESALLLGRTLGEVSKHVKPGVKTQYLDDIAEQFIRDHGAIPAFKGYGGFPATLCISVNDVVVHGFPGSYELKDGDIISVDCGTILNGFVGDSAYTFAVGEIKPEIAKLLEITKESLYLGIEKCVVGNRIGDIGHAIQSHVEKHGYSVVRELCGHGVGIKLHEEPNVLNYGKAGSGALLKEGMVIAIEPMINLGGKAVKFEKDGWTVRTKDGSPSAHFEHDVAIGVTKPDILSSFDFINQVS